MEMKLMVVDTSIHTKKNDGPTNGEVVKRCVMLDIPGGKSFCKTFWNLDVATDAKIEKNDIVKVHCDAINPYNGTMYMKGDFEPVKQ